MNKNKLNLSTQKLSYVFVWLILWTITSVWLSKADEWLIWKLFYLKSNDLYMSWSLAFENWSIPTSKLTWKIDTSSLSWTILSWNIASSSITSDKIADGTITNTDISSIAWISTSKIAVWQLNSWMTAFPPTNNNDIVTKSYVDILINNNLPNLKEDDSWCNSSTVWISMTYTNWRILKCYKSPDIVYNAVPNRKTNRNRYFHWESVTINQWCLETYWSSNFKSSSFSTVSAFEWIRLLRYNWWWSWWKSESFLRRVTSARCVYSNPSYYVWNI